MTDILSLIEPLLVGCLPESPPRGVRQGYGAIWQPEHTVPGMLAVWPHIERYARDQRLSVELPVVGKVSAWIVGDPVPDTRGLMVKIAYKVEEENKVERISRIIPWPDKFSRGLLMGQKVMSGDYQFRLASKFRMPSASIDGDKVRLQFPTVSIRHRGIVRGAIIRARIAGIIGDSTGASVQLPGLGGWLVSPRLVWS